MRLGEILQRLFLIAQQAIIGLRQVIQRDGIFVVVIYSLFVEGQRLVRVALRHIDIAQRAVGVAAGRLLVLALQQLHGLLTLAQLKAG